MVVNCSETRKKHHPCLCVCRSRKSCLKERNWMCEKTKWSKTKCLKTNGSKQNRFTKKWLRAKWLKKTPSYSYYIFFSGRNGTGLDGYVIRHHSMIGGVLKWLLFGHVSTPLKCVFVARSLSKEKQRFSRKRNPPGENTNYGLSTRHTLVSFGTVLKNWGCQGATPAEKVREGTPRNPEMIIWVLREQWSME